MYIYEVFQENLSYFFRTFLRLNFIDITKIPLFEMKVYGGIDVRNCDFLSLLLLYLFSVMS